MDTQPRIFRPSLPTTALAGSGALHLLAALAMSGYLLTPTPIQPPRLASLPMMTLTGSEHSPPDTTTTTPRPATRQTPVTRRQSKTAAPVKLSAPSEQATSRHAKPAPATSEEGDGHPSTDSSPSAASSGSRQTRTATVHEPLYRGGYLNNPKPLYPPLSLELAEQGTVRLRVQVSAQGLPSVVELAQSSGFPRLDRAALTAVRRWKFVPARQGDEAIPYTFIVPVEFSLKAVRPS